MTTSNETKLKQELEALKKQLQEAKDPSQSFYHEVFNKIKIGISIVTPEGLLYDVNDRLCEFVGMKREAIIGRNALSFFSASSQKDITANKRLESNEKYQLPFEHKSGETLWLEMYGQNCIIGNKPFRITAFRDITQQKKLELEHDGINQEYKLLFENLNEAFALHKIIVDKNNKPVDYTFVAVNAAFEKITGLQRENVIDKRVKEIMPETEAYWIETFGSVAQTGNPTHYSNYSSALNKYLETKAYSPKKGFFATIFSDITQQHLAEKALELHNKRLELYVKLSANKIHSIHDLLVKAGQELLLFLEKTDGFLFYGNQEKNFHQTLIYEKSNIKNLSNTHTKALAQILRTIPKGLHTLPDNGKNAMLPFKKEYKNTNIHVFNAFPQKDVQLTIGVLSESNETLEIYEKHLIPLLENIWQLIDKQNTLEQIMREKELAEITESRFSEIQKAGKIGWYEALLNQGLFAGSYETYNIFFDTYFDYPVKSENLIEALHPDDREHFFNTVQYHVANKSPEFDWEYRIISKTKGIKHVYSKAFLKFDAQGNLIRRYGIVQDITEKKQIELELKQHNQRLESMIKIAQLTANDANKLFDIALKEALKLTISNLGLIFRYNRQSKKITLDTHTKEHLFSDRLNALTDNLPIENTAELLQILNNNQAFVKNQFPIKRKFLHEILRPHAQINNIILVPTPINNDDFLWICMASENHAYSDTDIKQTKLLLDSVWRIFERQTYQNELIKAKEKAEESDKLKSAFLANMSHEIRTPMNGIIGFSELFIQEGISDEKRRNYANLVIDSGKQLLGIVDDILDISKIEVGQITLYKQATMVNDIITEIFSFYAPRAKQSNLSLFPYRDLTDAESVIITDKQRLIQILNNLLGNAFKFTSKGEISFGYIKKGTVLEFYVKDTGFGIPKHMHKAIFERFRQADLPNFQNQNGTGLGLSISQKLVELLGGKIYLESQENIGTTFYFTIPYLNVKNNDHQTDPSEETAEESKKYNLLIAEDEEINLVYLTEILTNPQVKIYHAKNGKEAIELCKAHPEIALVLMDVKMPVIDGLEATRQIKSIKPELPIIMQSAFAMDSDKEKAFAAGCSAFISKPINKKQLIATINKLLKNDLL